MLIDIEDFLSEDEIQSIRYNVEVKGMSLMIVADWFNQDRLSQKKYYNLVTFEEWTPFMGGANVQTLNSLLEPYHIAFGQGVYSG